METRRYILRKEHFGGLLYDRECDGYILIDKSFYDALSYINNTGDVSFLKEKQVNLLRKEQLILHTDLNCDVVESEIKGINLSAPIRIHYCYTNDCNMNCKHCFTKEQKHKSAELSFCEKRKMLDQLEKLGIGEILVGGGEPLFWGDDFLSFLDECNKRRIVVKVFTNGTLLTNDMAYELSKRDIKYISVSIDGTNEAEYEQTRGVRALEMIVSNIKNAKKYLKCPIAMSITVNNYNLSNARGYLEIAERANVDRIKIRPTKPSGNVLVNPEVYIAPEQYLNFLKETQTIWNEHFKGHFGLDFSWGDTRLIYNAGTNSLEIINNPFPYDGYGCFAGKGSMVIRANGDVSPCGFLPESMQICGEDNIREKSIKEMWDSGVRFRNLRNLEGNEKCLNCEYYNVCRGGCLARIIYDGKKLTDPDPWCLAKYFPAKLKG